MQKMIKRKTPSDVMSSIIRAAMQADAVTMAELGKRVNVSANTVCSDLKEPGKMTQDRLWLYFTALGIPIQEALNSIAGAFALKLAQRE